MQFYAKKWDVRRKESEIKKVKIHKKQANLHYLNY